MSDSRPPIVLARAHAMTCSRSRSTKLAVRDLLASSCFCKSLGSTPHRPSARHHPQHASHFSTTCLVVLSRRSSRKSRAATSCCPSTAAAAGALRFAAMSACATCKRIRRPSATVPSSLPAGAPFPTVRQRNQVDRDYSDTLPSLNVVFELEPDRLARLSASKVMSRPELGNLTPTAR